MHREHVFFYAGIILLIIIIWRARRGVSTSVAIGAGVNAQDARFPPGYSSSASGLTAQARRQMGITAY